MARELHKQESIRQRQRLLPLPDAERYHYASHLDSFLGADDMEILGKLFEILMVLFFGILMGGDQPVWVVTQILYILGVSPADITP
jgi:hypothetical protein